MKAKSFREWLKNDILGILIAIMFLLLMIWVMKDYMNNENTMKGRAETNLNAR